MKKVACIVEGDGEVRALPVLLRRMAEDRGVFDLVVPEPIRVARDRFMRRNEEFRRFLLLASAKAGMEGTVLVLLDADDDCPVTEANELRSRARAILPNQRLAVVLANKEYEAWLLAGAPSLAGKRGLRADLTAPADPEAVRNAKGWLSERMLRGSYHPVADQAALTAVFDIHSASRASRSLRKFIKVVDEALGEPSAA